MVPLENTGEIPMVEFTAFMSVALKQCGNDQRTFSELVDLWNREKETIKTMSRSELRDELECP